MSRFSPTGYWAHFTNDPNTPALPVVGFNDRGWGLVVVAAKNNGKVDSLEYLAQALGPFIVTPSPEA